MVDGGWGSADRQRSYESPLGCAGRELAPRLRGRNFIRPTRLVRSFWKPRGILAAVAIEGFQEMGLAGEGRETG